MTLMRYFTILFCIVLVLPACNTHKDKREKENPYSPTTVTATSYVVPIDSMRPPVISDMVEPVTVPVGEPVVEETNTNVVIAGEPGFMTVIDSLTVEVPGQGECAKPLVVKATDSSFIAGSPIVVEAKNAAGKDRNSGNFSFYQVKEGLRNSQIRCMMQDSRGNLWFGTYGGGAVRYDGRFFTHYTESQGLSNNYVWSILEDKKGNMWFGTNEGVSRFDGNNFTHYTEKGGLCNNEVMAIVEDSQGNMWFGTEGGGVSKYDGKNFIQYTVRSGLVSNYINTMKLDSKGNIWFATTDGICQYDGKSFTHFKEADMLTNDYVMSIAEDKEGSIWFTTNGGGVNKYVPAKDGEKAYFNYYTTRQGLSDSYVLSVAIDKNGNLWFGTYGEGVNKFDGETFTHYNETEGLSNDEVWCLLEDRSGNMWIGTNGGPNKYNGRTFTHYTRQEGLSNNVVLSVRQDSKGNMWFGTNGSGVNKYDGITFTHYTEEQGLTDNYVWCVAEDNKGNMWFGTNGGVTKYETATHNFVQFTEETGLPGEEVWSIMEDSKGNMWFGTNAGVCCYNGVSFATYTNRQGLSSNLVLSMLEDKKGNIWFGTDGGGVSCFNGKTFTHYTAKNGLSNNEVWNILEDRDGNLWFATEGGGVSMYNGKTFTQYTETQGLSHNVVVSMLQDKNGNIWIGTQNGLNKLTPASFKKSLDPADGQSRDGLGYFLQYNYPEGFLGISVRSNMVQDKSGYIWMGTGDRLTRYDPAGDFADMVAPNVQLTSVKLFSESVNWDEIGKSSDYVLDNGVTLHDIDYTSISNWYNYPVDVSLPYNNNYLDLNFIGISLKSPGQVKYRHILEGVDEDWSSLSNATAAPYGNLAPGKYTFKVQAVNGEGVWSKPFEYRFKIRPPWWQTWWFRIFALIAIVVLLYVLYRWRTAYLISRQKQLEQTVTERTAEVVAQKELVEERNKEITDSINYARRIQYALLAHDELLKQNLPGHFVFFKPKDIVSGDFYWATKKTDGNRELFYLAVCDSTGHGVPGAFMSLLNISFLNEAINEKNILQPNKVLDHVRQRLIENISQEGGRDGMDGTLMCFDVSNKTIVYASAYNSPVIIRKGEVMELGCDKMPIGASDKNEGFNLYTVDYVKGDALFMCTDGLADQFGGPRGKKYKNVSVNKLFAEGYADFGALAQTIATEFETWRGDLEQVDDICLIGIRL